MQRREKDSEETCLLQAYEAISYIFGMECLLNSTQPSYTQSHACFTSISKQYALCRAYLYIYKIARKREEGVFSSQDIYLEKYREYLHYINVCNSLFLLLFLLQTVTSGRMEGGFLLFIVHSYLNYRRISSYVYCVSVERERAVM